MKLSADQVQTKEVLDWKGVHLLNFSQSSCSQKVRILLSEKGVDYHSHEIDLTKAEHIRPWFLGINSRGVVPVLVHDGDVYVESNDILRYIDKTFHSTGFSWIPDGDENQKLVDKLLQLEDDLHDDLRVVTMGFLVPHKAAKKTDAELEAYAQNGLDDPYRAKQIAWWRAFGEHGITTTQAEEAVVNFHHAFSELNAIVKDRNWLLGDNPTVLDIAWFITLHRVISAGFPLGNYPALNCLYKRMKARPSFHKEIKKGPVFIQVMGVVYRFFRRLKGTSLKAVYQLLGGRVDPALAARSGSSVDDRQRL